MTTVKPEPLSAREGLRLAWRLFVLVRPYWPKLWKSIWMGFVIACIGLLAPLLTKMLVDDVYPSGDIGLMQALVLGTFLATAARTFAGGLRSVYTAVVAQRLSADLGVGYLERLMRLPTTFFDGRPVGEIISRGGDLQRGLGFVTGAFQTMLMSGLQVLVLPPVLLMLEWRLTLLVLVLTPATALVSLAGGRVLRRLSRSVAEKGADNSAITMELVQNARIIKSLAAEHEVLEGLRTRTHELRERQAKVTVWSSTLTVGMGLTRALSALCVSWFAWTLILAGNLSLGGFLAFSMYLGLLAAPMEGLVSLTVGLQEAAVSLSRFFEYFDAEPEEPADQRARRDPPTTVHGRLTFESVSFAYDSGREVLSDVSVDLAGGRMHAIVGPSGAGKSSLVRLILRMYEPARGVIRLDGVPIADYPRQWLRRQIGVVWQENGLFRGTVRDNVRLGATATDAQVLAALRAAKLDALLARLTAGLDTQISELGASLSGGERQRLAIARALVRNPSILVLDEATANLDPETERGLLEELALLEGVTVIFITHRLASASVASTVHVLKDGVLRGGQSHRELLESDVEYRRMWHSSESARAPGDATATGTGRSRP